jgi:hypothetical protein
MKFIYSRKSEELIIEPSTQSCPEANEQSAHPPMLFRGFHFNCKIIVPGIATFGFI